MNARHWFGFKVTLVMLASSVLGQTIQYSLPEVGQYDCASYNISATSSPDLNGTPNITYGVDRIASIFGNLILQPGNTYRLTNGGKGTYSVKPNGEIRFTGPLYDPKAKTYFKAKNGRFSIYLEFGATSNRAASRLECSRQSKAAQITVVGGPNPGLPGSLVFYRRDLSQKGYHRLEIAAGKLSRLPQGGYLRQSRNGELIFDNAAGEIVISTEGGQVRARQTEDIYNKNTVYRVRHEYTLSPNGKRYAYRADLRDGNFGSVPTVLVRDRDGSLLAQLPGYQSPEFLPDGRLLLAGIPKVQAGLYLTDATYSNPSRIDPDLSAPLFPAASPDGRSVAFVQDGKLYVMGLDGSGLRPLSLALDKDHTGLALGCPVWSPDGRWVAVITELDGTPYDAELMIAPVSKGPVQFLADAQMDVLHTDPQPPYCMSWR
jgi:WD40-like Beta Propeller Repeat